MSKEANRARITSVVFFVAAVLFYICSVIYFCGDRAFLGAMYLLSGSCMMFCGGTHFRKMKTLLEEEGNEDEDQ